MVSLRNVVVLKYFNQHYFSIETLNDEYYEKIKSYFSYPVPYFIRKNKGIFSKKLSILVMRKYLFRGLLDELIYFLESEEIPYLVDKELFQEFSLSYEAFQKFVKSLKLRYEPRDYQMKSVYKALLKQNALVLSPTSSGKSLMIALLAIFYHFLLGKKTQKKVLILVPSKTLVNQLFNDLIEYFPYIMIDNYVSMIHGEIPERYRDYSKPIIISTWQSIKRIEKDFKAIFSEEFLSQIGMLIYDEVHLSQAKVSREIVLSLPNVDFKIGLTGTLYDEKDGIYKNVLVKGLFGEIIEAISLKELIQMGFISDVQVFQFILDNKVRFFPLNYAEEMKYIADDENYKQFIVEIVKKFKDLNIFILYKHIRFGEKLFQLLKKEFNKVYKIDGSVEAVERERIRNIVEKSEGGTILLGTYGTISTGYSIKNLHVGIFAEGMKSRIKVFQSLGRMLRKHPSKKKAIVIDLVDSLEYINKDEKRLGFSMKHANIRMKYFLEEGIDFHRFIIEGQNGKES